MVLVAMPWSEPFLPSIQIGVLQALLERSGLTTESKSYYLSWLEFMLDAVAESTPGDYLSISNQYFGIGLGDWVFSPLPLNGASDDHQDQ
jgi:hypothetical protein